MSRKLWFDFKKKMCNALHFSIPYISKKSPIVTKTKKSAFRQSHRHQNRYQHVTKLLKNIEKRGRLGLVIGTRSNDNHHYIVIYHGLQARFKISL